MKVSGHDATMFSLYLLVIALGVKVSTHNPIIGYAQIVIGAGLFGLRLWILSKRAQL